MLELITGCRLHFGLLELAAGQPHRYGGLGMMVQAPRVRVRLKTDSDRSSQPSAVRIDHDELRRRITVAQACALAVLDHRAAESERDASSLWDDWEVVEAPPLHSGLGVGTQLAAAVATLVQYVWLQSKREQISAAAMIAQPRRLAQLSGRGKRSAIGLHGFLHGGLVQDLGYLPDAPSTATSLDSSVPPAVCRPVHTRSRAVPESWRVVLITSNCIGDMCGTHEEHLIQRAGTLPNSQRDQMLELSERCMDAVGHDNFAAFTSTLEHYMLLAANLFAPVQAGRYRDRATAMRVEAMQQAGLSAVGQSSWGPTVFGFAPTAAQAEHAAAALAGHIGDDSVHVIVTSPLNHGARIVMDAPAGAKHAS